MATAAVGPGFTVDMTALDIGSLYQGTVTYADSHLLQIAFSRYDFVDFVGNFTYVGHDVYGTLNQMRDYSNGYLWYSIGNMSVDAHTFQELAITGNTNGALSLVLAGNDVIVGGDGNDVLMGFGGNDVIKGGAGNDVLMGMGGSDRLVGGAGNDTMSGGRGNNTFVFKAGFNTDVITDFKPGTLVSHDTIELHSILGLNNFAQVKANATVVDGHVVISDTSGDSISLNSVQTVGQLHGYDFHFLV